MARLVRLQLPAPIITALDPQGEPLLIAGTDQSALTLIEQLRQRGYTGAILLFGERPFSTLELARLAELQQSGEAKYRDVPLLKIDPQRKIVTDAGGKSHRYQALVLASSARPRVPSIPGIGAAGVHLFYQREQLVGLINRFDPHQRIAVVGGGLLGVMMAAGLARHGFGDVHLLQQEMRLMHNRLDDSAATLLHHYLEGLGVQIRLDSRVTEVKGLHGRVTALRLRDGHELAVNHVILATGIKPNIKLARDARLRVGSGIVVDDRLQTSSEGIHALGACAEHRGVVHGLVAPALEQAAVIAAFLTGEAVHYQGSMSVNQQQVGELSVFSHGQVTDIRRSPFTESIIFHDQAERIYRKLVLHKGVLIGAVAIGPLAEKARLEEAINSKRKLPRWRLWRYRLTGQLWPEQYHPLFAGPDNTVVCRCTGVTAGQLASGDPIARRAGTICGTCRSQLPGAGQLSL